MTTQRACDVCKFFRQDHVRRYVLQRAADGPARRYTMGTRYREGGEGRGSGAGSIDLCDECWERIAKPRMRSRR